MVIVKAMAKEAAADPDMMRYRAEDALRTIHRAHEHMQDKALMGHVKKIAAAQSKAVGAPMPGKSPAKAVTKSQDKKPGNALAAAASKGKS